jgi:transcriptional regulator with XRE-family HTH domain
MNTWHERLKYAMQQRNVRPADLVRVLNISPPGIKRWLDGEVVQPKYADVIKLCDFLKINDAWLMSGEGTFSEQLPSANSLVIERIGLSGSCGLGKMSFTDTPNINRIIVDSSWFERNFSFYNPKNVKIVTAEGDSMKPDIEDGDAVFIDISDNTTLRDGVYFILVDGEHYIKRIQKLIGRKIALISSNPAYKDLEVPLDSDIEIRIIGRVIKSMRLIDL